MKYPTLLERFLTYVKVNTRSDETSTTTPSTASQVEFAKNVLLPEMERVGLQNVYYLPNGFAIGTLPANDPSLTRKIGFISHMDTADFNAENIRPQVIENYDGGTIALGDSGYSLDPADFANLLNYKGQTLITTDGTTLLGADDKSGIAEIMTAIEYLNAHPEIKHCEIRVGFGPDEEIGVGADKFDVKKFGADFAYTVDGGKIGELQYENFNAAYAKISVQGRNVHPGEAKDKMINAVLLAIRLNDILPKDEIPSKTEKYEGFYHICDFSGNEEHCDMYYIIRDFDRAEFEEKKKYLQECVDRLNEEFDEKRISIKMKDQYYNMKEKIEPMMYIVEKAKIAMQKADVNPLVIPIRGGTDGARLSFEGLPTPNIFTTVRPTITLLKRQMSRRSQLRQLS